ncbi:hypothetical protein PV350_04655 [Streptomyces sp. PA03-6a]|nr:hypothetical protein [Streptomyces sp. PA03-6a]
MSSSLNLPGTDTIVKNAATYGRDLAERVTTTFLEGFLGGVVVTTPFDGHMWQAAAIGGVSAAVSLVKGLVARWRSVTNSASLAKGV